MVIAINYYDETTKEDEMGWAYSTNGEPRNGSNFWQENLTWTYLLGCTVLVGRIILKYIIKK
jgi:hypothetical protein